MNYKTEKEYDDFCENIVSKFEYLYTRLPKKVISVIVTICFRTMIVLLKIHTFLNNIIKKINVNKK